MEVNGTVEIMDSVEMHSCNYFLKATSACVGKLLLLHVIVYQKKENFSHSDHEANS